MLTEPPSAATIARELARRLRAGEVDAATIEAAAGALEVMASLYERSRGVLAKALDHLRGEDNDRQDRPQEP
jgi:hypothetical protein